MQDKAATQIQRSPLQRRSYATSDSITAMSAP